MRYERRGRRVRECLRHECKRSPRDQIDEIHTLRNCLPDGKRKADDGASKRQRCGFVALANEPDLVMRREDAVEDDECRQECQRHEKRERKRTAPAEQLPGAHHPGPPAAARISALRDVPRRVSGTRGAGSRTAVRSTGPFLYSARCSTFPTCRLWPRCSCMRGVHILRYQP